jgi:hypothetical protein
MPETKHNGDIGTSSLRGHERIITRYLEEHMSNDQLPSGATTPHRLSDLSPAQRRRVLLRTTVRCVAVAAALITFYYILPLDRPLTDVGVVTRLLVGSILFVAVMTWQLWQIINADLPELRAVQSLASMVPLFLIVFAATYVTQSNLSLTSFSEPLDHTGGLYFVIVTFATVGYGDIAPKSDLARLLVSAQILCDLVFLGAGLRFIFGVSRRTLDRDETGGGRGDA